MRGNLLQGACGGQRSFLQPGVYVFRALETFFEIADPLTKAAHFLSDRLEVFQA